MSQPPDSLHGLLRSILATEASEIDCEQTFDRLAAFADVGGGEASCEVPAELGKVRQHLSVCPECVEVFDALCRARGV